MCNDLCISYFLIQNCLKSIHWCSSSPPDNYSLMGLRHRAYLLSTLMFFTGRNGFYEISALGTEHHCTCRTGYHLGEGGKKQVSYLLDQVCHQSPSLTTALLETQGFRKTPLLQPGMPPSFCLMCHSHHMEDSKVAKEMLWKVWILW